MLITVGTSRCIVLICITTQIGSPSRNGKGEIHIWVRRGAVDRLNSNSIQTVDRGTTSVLVYSTVFQTPAYRPAALVYSSSTANKCTSLGLIATASDNEPVVPSIITSVIQLGDDRNIIPYAELLSLKTQLGDSSSNVIRLDSSDAVNRIDTTDAEEDGIIKYNESGLYFIIARGEVGSAIDSHASGEVHLWMRLNGEDMSNSNTIQSIRNGRTAVLVSQTIVKLEANDKVKLMFSITDNELGMIASSPKNEPTVPSMIFSTFRLRDKGKPVPYAQLSSSQSQWGCITSNVVRLNINDGSQRIDNDNGIIKFYESGTYFVMAAAQVGSDDGQGIGDVHLWMRLNGKDVANSNTIQTINKDTSVLICQTAVEIQSGDKIQMVFSTDVMTGKLGLVATKPDDEPLVPSMIFSVFKSSYLNDN